MAVSIADVLFHIDENLDKAKRSTVEDHLRQVEGVVSVHNPDDRPHLTLVGYRPDRTSSEVLLGQIQAQGVHAEMIGL